MYDNKRENLKERARKKKITLQRASAQGPGRTSEGNEF